jgi:hypothetical protein
MSSSPAEPERRLIGPGRGVPLDLGNPVLTPGKVQFREPGILR